MPSIDGIQIYPLSDWQAFQRLCLDLWKRIWNDPNAQEYGRLGQRQNGIDIFGTLNGSSDYAAVQCKDKDMLSGNTLTVSEIRTEVQKAKQFSPKLKQFTIAYIGPRDKRLQDEANRITVANARQGLFSVTVCSWPDLLQLLGEYPEIAEKHYPGLFHSTSGNSDLNPRAVGTIVKEFSAATNQLDRSISEQIRNNTELLRTNLKAIASKLPTSEIGYSKNLLDSHKPEAALDYLNRYEADHWHELPEIDKFRLLTNKATAYLQLQRYTEAGPLFIRALQYNKDDEKGNVNAALGYFLLVDRDNAAHYIEITLSKNPLNFNAWSLRIQLAVNSHELTSVLKTVPPSISEKPEILWAQGVVLMRFGEFKDAEAAITHALGNDTERRVELLAYLGAIQLKNILDRVKLTGTPEFLPEELSDLRNCLKLFDELLEKLKRSDSIPTKIEALVKRGTIHRLLGKLDLAGVDFRQALDLDNNNYDAALQNAILLAQESRYSDAIRCIHAISAYGRQYELKLLLGDLYRLVKNYPMAIQTLAGCEDWDAPKRRKLHGFMIATDVFLEIHDVTSARGAAIKAESLSPDSPVPSLLHARVERYIGNLDEAKRRALEAKSKLTTQVQFIEEWKLAEELVHLALLPEAAQVFERLAIPEKNDELTRGLIQSYYDSGQWEKALDACNRLRKSHPEVQYATELASAIYEESGNLPQAIEALQTYLSVNPNDQHSRLRLSFVFWRAGRLTDVDDQLSRINTPQSFGPRDALQYSLIIANRGKNEEAVRFLYEMRRKYPDDAAIDMAYSGVILMRSETLQLMNAPEWIKQDTVVTVKNEDNLDEIFIIESRSDPEFSRREVDINHPIAKRLLGKRTGDQVDIENNPFQRRISTVTEVTNKFTYALHDAMFNHHKRFPDKQDLLSFRVPTDEHGQVDALKWKQQIVSVLPDQNYRQVIEQLYRSRKLTVGAVSKLSGRDLITTMVYLASTPELGIYVSSGGPVEYQTALDILRRKNGIVIDPTSLLLSQLLDIKEFLSDRYGPLSVSQSTLDLLREVFQLRSMASDRSQFTIFQENGELYRHEVSAEDRKKQLDELSSLIDWVEKNCVVLPVNLGLSMPRSEKEQIDDVFGKPFSDSILLAKENNLTLLSEDGILRGLADGQYSIKSIWIHAIAAHAIQLGYIDEDKFNEVTVRLVSLNMNHTPVNANILLYAAEKSAWRPRPPLETVLFNLTGHCSSEETAVRVATDFILEVWSKPLLPITRNTLVFSLLDALTTRRDRGSVLRSFESLVDQRLRLWPQAAEQIVALIRAWKTRHVT